MPGIDWTQVGETVILAAAVLTALGVLYKRIVEPMVERVVRGAVRSTVNGGLAQIDRRLDRHDRRHAHERRQLVAALDRNGISPPDGWREIAEDGL